jgi:hypothetical protein
MERSGVGKLEQADLMALIRMEQYYNPYLKALNRIHGALMQNGIVSNSWCAEQAGVTVSRWRDMLKETADIG